jgi:hypothetical protein
VPSAAASVGLTSSLTVTVGAPGSPDTSASRLPSWTSLGHER